MTSTIVCPHCKKDLELSEALQHQIEEQVLLAEREKHKIEIENARQEEHTKTSEKIKNEFEMQLRLLKEENVDSRENKKKLEEQLIEITREMRKVRQDAENTKIDLQKKLVEEEDKIRQEERQRTDETHRLKDMEKDKKLQDAIKANEELRRKLEQGSQQTQGEVLELELEALLKSEFPRDVIKPVAKGVRGADVIQIVMDKSGRECGSILWESKNAKWTDTWITKLKHDKRAVGAQFAVLVSVNLPNEIKNFAPKGDVWVTDRVSVVGLAYALRTNVGQVFYATLANEGKDEKMEDLFKYFSSTEFKHRIEAIVETFSNFQLEMEREKRWFSSKWARQEKELRKVIDTTHGMYGDLQGIIGASSMPQVKGLEMMELESGE